MSGKTARQQLGRKTFDVRKGPACEELAELLATVDTRSIDLDDDNEIVLRQPWGAISWELYCESGDLAQFLTLESAEMAQRALGRTLERLTAIVEHQAARHRLPHYHLALGGETKP